MGSAIREECLSCWTRFINKPKLPDLHNNGRMDHSSTPVKVDVAPEGQDLVSEIRGIKARRLLESPSFNFDRNVVHLLGCFRRSQQRFNILPIGTKGLGSPSEKEMSNCNSPFSMLNLLQA